MSHDDFFSHLWFGEPADYSKLDFPAPEKRDGRIIIERRYLASLAEMAFSRIAFHLPRSHAQKIAAIAGDASASPTERFLAASLLQNAAIAAEGIFPLCQDTGSALVYGWKGERCESRDSAAFAGSPSCAGGASPIGDDALSLAQGIDHAYAKRRLRASQLRPLDVIAEQNTRDNLPAGIDIRAVSGNVYHLLFCAKGGGSTGKTTLTMESPSLLLPDRLKALLSRRISDLGTSGCPPYTISAVIGGVTPSQALYALELANFGLLDRLPESPAPLASPGSKSSIALRSREWEGIMMRLATDSGIGLQWGGSHMALDTRFVRLSRHAANLPVAIGVSCVAHRKALALINEHGWFLERLEDDPAKLLPAEMPVLPDAVPVNFDLPMREWLGRLRSMPAGTKLLLSGIVTLARDAAHARLQARLERGESLPSSVVEHPIFYAGPTEPADGQVTGSIGPTTAKRMDSYMEPFMRQGAGLVTIGKGERSQSAASVIAQFGGIYLAAIGGTAAMNARNHVKESRIEDYADLGMEAIRSVRLTDLPAIVAIDASGSSIYCKSKHEASPKT